MSFNIRNVSVGFRNDLQSLLDKFAACEEIGMTSFTRIWKEMKFLQIFMYREEKEIVLYTEDCFRIVLSYITGQQPISIRIGALFCLYSLYLMQPSNPKLKIRLTAELWKSLNTLVDESHLEACESEIQYVFWTLFHHPAFLFVATPTVMTLLTNSTDDDTASSSLNLTEGVEEYLNSDNKYLKEVHTRYMALKDSLNAGSTNMVQMVDKDLFTDIKNKVDTLKEKYASIVVSAEASKLVSSSEDDEHDQQDEDSNYSDEDTLERRRQVRQKHQVIQAKPSKSRRHRAVQFADKKSKAKGRGRPKAGTSSRQGTGGERPFSQVTLSEDVDGAL